VAGTVPKRSQKKTPVAGETIVLTTQTKFTDTAVLSRFRIVEHQVSQTQETAPSH
jgi:hypothetical protein